jgi:chromatin segregation and condensation protein Rec8/ScpA/Scc1 (kleisin family)
MDAETKPLETAAPAEDGQKQEKKRRKKKWGAETEAGKQVLNELETQQETPPEPVAKKRRSRWEPQAETTKTAIAPGLEIALPASLAHLADLNPEVLELQRKLTNVSRKLPAWQLVMRMSTSHPCFLNSTPNALAAADQPKDPADTSGQLRG